MRVRGNGVLLKKGTREHKDVMSIMQGATVYTKTGSKQTRRKQRAEAHPSPLRPRRVN
jgi:hypothetical protein